MSSFAAELRVETDVLDALDDAAVKAPGLTQTAYERQVRRSSSRLLAKLRQMPGKPTYKLRWKSRRQMRYVIAKLREEGNLPYQRTGEMVKRWKIVAIRTPEGGVASVENDSPVVGYVQGDFAQPYHLDTGWTQAAPEIVKIQDELTDNLIDTWYTVTDPFAGVPQ